LSVRIRSNSDFLRLGLFRFVFGNGWQRISIRAAATCFAATVNFPAPLCIVHPAGNEAANEISWVFAVRFRTHREITKVV